MPAEFVKALVCYGPGFLTKRGRGKKWHFRRQTFALRVSCFRYIFLITHFLSSGLSLKQSVKEELRKTGISSVDFGGLIGIMANYMVDSKSQSTLSKYFSYFRKWECFVTSKGGGGVIFTSFSRADRVLYD